MVQTQGLQAKKRERGKDSLGEKQSKTYRYSCGPQLCPVAIVNTRCPLELEAPADPPPEEMMMGPGAGGAAAEPEPGIVPI